MTTNKSFNNEKIKVTLWGKVTNEISFMKRTNMKPPPASYCDINNCEDIPR